MQRFGEKVVPLYSLFQLIYPMIGGHFEELNLGQYAAMFDNLMLDFAKKTDLVKKLTFGTMYTEKMKVRYEDESKKIEEF